VYSETARYYDRIYANKDYALETQRIVDIVGTDLPSNSDRRPRLLDVACGTGRHIEYLKAHYDVEGLDLCPELLAIARRRNPEISFHQGDMVDLDLGRTYDVVTCLFSAIGYVKTLDRLRSAISSMARHLAPGGLLLVEPWFTPDAWHPGGVHATFVDDNVLKIARVNTSEVEGRLSSFTFHYLIGTPEGVEHLTERHELGLFEMDEMCAAFTHANLTVRHDPEGLTGRGLYLGRREESACRNARYSL
jgi:SAM-dependent methyltransferase